VAQPVPVLAISTGGCEADMSEDIEKSVKITLTYKDVSEDLPAVVEIRKDGDVISLNTREVRVLLKWLPFLLEEKKQAKIELTIPSYE
jgi:hypothetical protein